MGTPSHLSITNFSDCGQSGKGVAYFIFLFNPVISKITMLILLTNCNTLLFYQVWEFDDISCQKKGW